jgi:apoptosis-inducing factor 2
VLLIEPHSHFHHLFAFVSRIAARPTSRNTCADTTKPRFAIVPNHEHKAFIPYTGVFAGTPDPSRHAVVKARAIALKPKILTLDREWQGSKELPFDYLVAATGTKLSPPGTMESDEKAPSVQYFKDYQEKVKNAKTITIIGGGAVGVQMACDLKEVYPEKEVTLVHSRETLMPVYHEALSNIIKDRFKELGVK